MRFRLSLLGKFSLLSLLVIAALGVAIGAMLHERVERRALIDAGRDAELLGRIGVQGEIGPRGDRGRHADGRAAARRRRLALLHAALFRIVAGASRRLRKQALHDGLTGLPNRTLLHERAQGASRSTARS